MMIQKLNKNLNAVHMGNRSNKIRTIKTKSYNNNKQLHISLDLIYLIYLILFIHSSITFEGCYINERYINSPAFW